MAKGGTRVGGKPKGYKAPQTLEKEEARRVLRERVNAKLVPLVDAQIANAMGISYLIVRNKQNGKFIRVTEAMAKVRQTLKDSEEIVEVWEKDPSVQAFTDLINRTIDKPAEHVELTGKDNGPVHFKWKS